MIELNRNSLVIRQVDFESEQYKKFERNFSLYNSVTHKYEYNIYSIIDNDIHIPVTVGLSSVLSFFPNEEISKNFSGTAQADKIEMEMLHQPRTEIQSESLGFLLSIKADYNNRHRMLNLATGSGKTYVTIATISQIKQKAFIVVDTVDLAAQWKKEILFHSNLTDSDILIISGRDSVEEAKTGNYKIFIAIHKTLGMLLSEDLNAINELMHKLHIGVRVFDECHVDFHNICLINSLSNVNYTILLTATPNRSDYKEDKLYLKVFGKIPSYDGNKKDNEKYHKVILAQFDSHPTEKQKVSVRTKYGFSLVKWANFVAEDDPYKYYIESLKNILDKTKLIDLDKKIAIMLPTINLIDKTYDDLHTTYPHVDIGKFIGDVKKSKRGEELDKKLILTNQKIFGKGIDVPDLDCIINYVQLSSTVNLEQIIGRLRNNEGYSHVLIDVTDNGYAECRNQLKLRKRFYKKIAKQIIELK